MRVLIAVSGAAVTGELVVPATTCDTPGCGCGDLWTGLSSRAYADIAAVVERDVDLDMLASLIAESATRAGWRGAEEWAGDLAADVADLAAEFELGTNLVRRDDQVEPL